MKTYLSTPLKYLVGVAVLFSVVLVGYFGEKERKTYKALEAISVKDGDYPQDESILQEDNEIRSSIIVPLTKQEERFLNTYPDSTTKFQKAVVYIVQKVPGKGYYGKKVEEMKSLPADKERTDEIIKQMATPYYFVWFLRSKTKPNLSDGIFNYDGKNFPLELKIVAQNQNNYIVRSQFILPIDEGQEGREIIIGENRILIISLEGKFKVYKKF